jgi:hypothetical protein
MDDTPAPPPRPSSPRPSTVKVYGGGGARAAAPKKASPVLAGVLFGVLAAVVWALVVYFTGYEIGWVAWGVGALVGYAVSRSAHEPDAALGPTAAALAVASLLLAKVLIIEFAAPSAVTAEVLKNRETVAAMFLVDMRLHKSFSPELEASVEQLEDRPGSLSDAQRFQLQQQIQAEALQRAAGATRAERERVVRAGVDRMLDAMGFFGMAKLSFSGWDLLWFGLAISSAFKVAQRG